jgi:hypothetical protein
VLTSASGKHIEFSGNPLFSDLFEKFRDNLEYQLYIEGAKGAQVICTGKDKTKILGSIYKVGKGNLIVLPYIKYDSVKFTEHRGKGENKKEYWTKDAIQFGKSLVKMFVDIDKALQKSGDRTAPPDWTNQSDFQLHEEKILKEQVEETTKEIGVLIVKKGQLLTKIEQEIKLRDLLFETGKTLENAINLALKILGYSSEGYNDGVMELDHIIISPERDRFIGEAEGKDSSAVNIDKLRQLLINIHEDLQRAEVEIPAVGILFGNGFRLIEPSRREEQFTAKCLSVAKTSSCALVKTSDLFRVAKYVKESEDRDFAKKCREVIKSSIGKIVLFPDLPAARGASV